MRWSNAYLGLVAAALGFAAVVLLAEDVAWYSGPLPLLLVAAGFLGAMALRSFGAGARRVLLVGEPGGRPAYRLREELDDAGFGFRTCPGPDHRPCPAMQGGPCPIRGSLTAAIVYSPERGTEPPCGAALGVAELTIAEASPAEPVIEGVRGRVGWQRGPAVAVGALLELIEPGR